MEVFKMKFLKNIGETVNGAIDFVVEKNRKFTKIAKIKSLIKKESDSILKDYITLGKHYYNDLRDVPDNDMKKVCDSIDTSKKEIAKLKEKLMRINMLESFSAYNDFSDDDLDLKKEAKCNCKDLSTDKYCQCSEEQTKKTTENCYEKENSSNDENDHHSKENNFHNKDKKNKKTNNKDS